MTKYCSRCKQQKEFTEFNKHARQRHQNYCKLCQQIRWFEYKYKRSYNEYFILYDKQGGRCAICATSTPGGRFNTFHFDHDHVSGKSRGLLCWLCNSGLGKFKDDIKLLDRAKEYLNENKNS